jgi:chaperonin GroEL
MNGFPNTETTTQIVFSGEARKQLWEGMKAAADVVGCTLGPRGKTVIIQRPGQSPLVTKDGITCSKSIRLKDPVQRMGAELIREAAAQTNEVAGDGTTTATVLTAALVEGGLKLVEAGYSPLLVCRGIEQGAKLVGDMLVNGAKKVETSAEIMQVGTISANGDASIGQLIATAMERVGNDGIITVEDAKGLSTTMDVVEGMQFERGYLSPYFVTDAERMRVQYENAYVLVTDGKLSVLKDIVPILEQVMRQQRPLLIVAEDVEGEAMTGLVINRVKGGLPVVAIKAPGYGQHRSELLQDICALTGAHLVSAATGLKVDKMELKDLGQCKKLTVDAKTTTIVGTGHTKAAVDQHVAELRAQLDDVTLGDDDKNKLKLRVAKLASGVAVIRVGGATETEMGERKYRVEDALNATKAAAQEGIVPGGGQALHVCSQVLLDTLRVAGLDREVMAGIEVVAKACMAPLRRIVANAGQVPEVIIAELDRRRGAGYDDTTKDDIQNVGYNAATGAYEDLVKAGVIDPVKVTRLALKNAASVATTFLTLDAVIYDETPSKSDGSTP